MGRRDAGDLGLLLIGLEAFVIPGFGVAGIAGGAALLGGIFISLINFGGDTIVTNADLTRAMYTLLGALAMMIVGTLVVFRYLPRSSRLAGLVLQSQVGRQDAVLEPERSQRRGEWITGARLESDRPLPARSQDDAVPSLLGATGMTLLDLRPSGFAEIEGLRVDVVTRGDYINAGERVEVIVDEGYRRVVRRVPLRDAVTGVTQPIEA